jgi:hypothetical protein
VRRSGSAWSCTDRQLPTPARDSMGRVTLTSKPRPPGPGPMRAVPPCAAARSRTPIRPWPPPGPTARCPRKDDRERQQGDAQPLSGRGEHGHRVEGDQPGVREWPARAVDREPEQRPRRHHGRQHGDRRPAPPHQRHGGQRRQPVRRPDGGRQLGCARHHERHGHRGLHQQREPDVLHPGLVSRIRSHTPRRSIKVCGPPRRTGRRSRSPLRAPGRGASGRRRRCPAPEAPGHRGTRRTPRRCVP